MLAPEPMACGSAGFEGVFRIEQGRQLADFKRRTPWSAMTQRFAPSDLR